MILQSLVDYYEVLVRKEKAVKPGWCKAKVSYALNLFPDGTLKGILPLQEEQQKGKKTVMCRSYECAGDGTRPPEFPQFSLR